MQAACRFFILLEETTGNQTVIESTLPSQGTFHFDDRYKKNYVDYLKENKIVSESEFKTRSVDDLFREHYDDNKTISVTDLAGIQYYRNFSNQRSDRHHIAPDDGRNAGLVNNDIICYANAILQIIASCVRSNEALSNPPDTRHEHFSLYYNFASVISSMISGGNEAVNPNNFTNVFSERVPQFENEQRKYLLYQMYRL